MDLPCLPHRGRRHDAPRHSDFPLPVIPTSLPRLSDFPLPCHPDFPLPVIPIFLSPSSRFSSPRHPEAIARDPPAPCPLPPLRKSRKKVQPFCGSPIRGAKGGLSMLRSARARQSLSHFVTAPFTQGSLAFSTSCPPCVKGGPRGDCSAKNRAGTTTLPSGSFLACHLPLHRGGKRSLKAFPLGDEPRVMRITTV